MTRFALPQRKFVLLTLAAFGLAMAVLASGCSAEANAEMKTYGGINAIRTQAGLPPLTPDQGLVRVARARSDDMAAKGYFGHNPPDGCKFVCIMDKFGVPHAWAGENIAWNDWDWSETADVAVRMWHNSAPHMENIMNCHYTKFGTGVAQAADGKVYYTMIFDGNADC
jgi:uncharacterized protein YkwD